jgi:hypothetical protein
MDHDDSSIAVPKSVFDEPVSDIVAARLIGRVLFNAARTLGVECDSNTPIESRCGRIIMAAQRGGIDADSYRLAWMMRRVSCCVATRGGGR